MRIEEKIVWLIDPKKHGIRYAREAVVPAWVDHKDFRHKTRYTLAGADTATVAYSIDDQQETHRVWFVYQPSRFDGVDPLEFRAVSHRVVDVRSIQANEPSRDYDQVNDVEIGPHRQALQRLQRDWHDWTLKHAKHRIQLPRSKARRFFGRLSERINRVVRRFLPNNKTR